MATYEQPFSKQDKEATTQNMLVMGMVKNGGVTFAYPEDARRNLFVQRKQYDPLRCAANQFSEPAALALWSAPEPG